MRRRAVLVLLAGSCVVGLAGCPSCPPVREFQPAVKEGGRAGSLAVHPSDNDAIVVASETGGLFRSSTGGATWRHLQNLPSPFTRDVAYAPGNPSVLIVTTGGRFRIAETGIWRSSDGGSSWAIPAGSRAPEGPRCPEVVSAHGIAFAPDTSRLFVGTDCGLATSDDLGASWTHTQLDPSRPVNGKKTQNRVFSVLAQSGGRIVAAGEDGIWRSQDGGTTWQKASSGPGWLRYGVIHGLAASPYAAGHLFLAHRNGDQSTLHLSADGGDTWTLEKSFTRGWARPVFVQTVSLPAGPGGQQFRVFFGEGVRVRSATYDHHAAAPSSQNDWATVPDNHSDPSHFAIHSDGATPLVLATDGGVHKDNAGVWELTGAGAGGYNALQITEITGQEVSGAASHQDLYYGTQDNGVLGSSDGGATWAHRRCCEGFFLRTPPQSVNHSTSKVTGVKCGGCVNFITDQHLQNLVLWPNAPDGDSNPDDVDGNPFLLPKPGHYIQRAINHDDDPLVHTFKLTKDHGATWADAYVVDPPPRCRPLITGPASDPYIYQAVKRPGTTPQGFERIGLKQIRGIYAPSGATVTDADVSGLGSIGIFPTMFAWYSVFGVDPWSPGHLIAADVETEEMKHSHDGGQSWHVDEELTGLMTEGGTYRFALGRFPMASTIGFDPYARCHILVGTVQNGIFRSTDGGRNWKQVKKSTRVTNVSSFYFPSKGQIYVSTYGRGLWKLKVSRPNPFRCLPLVTIPGQIWPPSIWDLVQHIERPFKWPPDVPEWCPQCSFVIVKHGLITDIQRSDSGVSGFKMSGGFVTEFDARGKPIDLQIPNAYGPGTRSQGLATILEGVGERREGPLAVRGLVLDGRKLRGVVVSASDLPVDAGPAPALEAQTRFSSAGMALVEAGEPVTLHATGFGSPTERGGAVVITVDGEVVAREMRAVKERGLRATIKLDPIPGPREVVVEQRQGNRLTRVTTTVLVVPGDDFEEDRPK